MANIVNPLTVLANSADAQAMAWIKTNTPPDAYFAINVWPWFRQRYAGSDGGYWIATLTDRRSILPATIYSSTNIPHNLLKEWA